MGVTEELHCISTPPRLLMCFLAFPVTSSSLQVHVEGALEEAAAAAASRAEVENPKVEIGFALTRELLF